MNGSSDTAEKETERLEKLVNRLIVLTLAVMAVIALAVVAGWVEVAF